MTRAVLDGNQYVVNGQKVWTSRALQSDLMLLLARTTSADEVARRRGRLCCGGSDQRAREADEDFDQRLAPRE